MEQYPTFHALVLEWSYFMSVHPWYAAVILLSLIFILVWDMIEEDEERHKATLQYAADNWDAVEELRDGNES
jgi:cytochrome b